MITRYPNGYGRRERAPECIEPPVDTDCPACLTRGGKGSLAVVAASARKRLTAAGPGSPAMQANGAYREDRSTQEVLVR